MFALLCLCLTGAGPAPAYQVPDELPLKVVGVQIVGPYQLVRLRAEGGPKGAGVIWDVWPAEKVDVVQLDGELLMVAPPGDYRVRALAVALAGGKTVIRTDTVTVQIQGPAPPPAPAPALPDGRKADPMAAIVKIAFGTAGCSATIVGPRRPDGRWDVLTARHCLRDLHQRGVMTLKDGRRLGVTPVTADPDADLCWLVTDVVVEDLPFAMLAKDLPPVGTPVWHAGYGVDRPGNVERGRVDALPGRNNRLRFHLNVSSGDSGGGIFRTDTGELVGSVCCTMSRGSPAAMWGGSSVRALAIRPDK